MVTGDDARLPARDKGPVRRYIRDYIDARWNLGEFMLPVMLIVLALTLHAHEPDPVLRRRSSTYAVLLTAVVDAFLMWRGSRRSSSPSSARTPPVAKGTACTP